MSISEIAGAHPFEGAPRINIARLIGASRGRPILIRIPATGERPMNYSVVGLPTGLTHNDGVITGKIDTVGDYVFTLIAENSLGKAEKTVTLEIKERSINLTPLMGFTSWNAFGASVTQEKMEATASRIVDLGLSEYGYLYVNTDSGWQGEYGGKFDAIMPNEKFPDMKAMCDKIHSLGLKCGIYANPMKYAFGWPPDHKAPGCTQGDMDIRFKNERGGIGLIRKEKNNALQWADWGFDYLKYDWNPADAYNAEIMRSALVSTDRDFGFCISLRVIPEYIEYWKSMCQSYRCNPDSVGTWESFMGIYRSYFDFIEHVNKGHFFDLDMLDIGKCEMFEAEKLTDAPDFGFTDDEKLIVYSSRAFFASPIQLSCNLDYVTDFELSMYCNDEIIAINQDCLFDPAKPIITIEKGEAILHVFKKKLEDGSVAYAFFNLGKTKESVTVHLDGESEIRDVWAKKNIGEGEKIDLTLQPHTVRIIKARSLV